MKLRQAVLVFKVVILVLTCITILSVLVAYALYIKRLEAKEAKEKLTGQTNRDAYQLARALAGFGALLGVAARGFGLFAVYGERLVHCLLYGAALLTLAVCWIVGVLRLTAFDITMQFIIIVLTAVYARLLVTEDTHQSYIKDTATLPL